MPFLAKSGENICKYGSFVVPLPNKFSENKHKTTKINDQRMKINEVIERHGMQLRDVSREMGMKPSALQSAIDRNLTVKTLRLISEAARIPIAEFFADELPAGFTLTSSGTEEAPKTDASSADDLPFDNSQPSVQMQQAIICPHCKKAMTITVQA
jgi:lambda repressor-like predicted transcriptional regulator